MSGISWERFLKSKWLPWMIVVFLLTAGGGNLYEVTTEREEYRKENVELERQVKTLTFEVASAEWALKQEQEKQRATKKTREERKPDGTVIVEKEETDETTNTKTDSSGSSKTETTTDVVDTETSKRETEVSVTETSVSKEGTARWGLDIGIHRQLVGGGRGTNRVSTSYELDFGIAPVVDIYLPDTLNGVEGLGIGIEVRF